MKKNLLLALSVCLITAASSATEAPKSVQENFAKKFPAAKSVKWDKEGSKEYEASFVLDGVKCSANFSTDGTWLETETEIKISELPTAVTSAIKAKYADWEIKGAAKMETSKGETKFEADLKKGKKEKEVQYKADGTFIK